MRVQVPNAMGQFFGGRTCPGMPDDTVVSCAKTAEPVKKLFGLTRVGPRKHVLDGVQIPHMKEQFLVERICLCIPKDTLL